MSVAICRSERSDGMDTFIEEVNEIIKTAQANIPEETILVDGVRHCPVCHKPVEIFREYLGEVRSLPIMCDCVKERERIIREQARLQALADARRRCFDGDYSRLSDARLSDCYLEHPHEAEMLSRYVEKWSDMYHHQKGLILWGANGTGKSFMAAALCNALIDDNHECRFTTFPRIDRQASGTRSDRQAYIDSLNDPALLVLDDLGSERSSEYMQELVFSVIDSRYESGKPMVITTNLTLTDLKNPQTAQQSRIYDRVLQVCYPIKIDGNSLRRKDTIQRFYDMKKELEG